MTDPNRRRLGDRQVWVVRHVSGERRPARLRWWRTGGLHEVKLQGPSGPLIATGDDLFAALAAIRRRLERDGWAVLVQGSRRDVYPSEQARGIRGAERVQPFGHGGAAGRAVPPVMIFADADPATDDLATVDEQRAAWDAHVAAGGRVRKVRGDREIQVIAHGGRHPARVRWFRTEDDFGGVELTGPFGIEQAIDESTFDALAVVRRRIEPDGWRVGVQGARRDTYPSGMQREAGGGDHICVLRIGEGVIGTVDTFEPIDPEQAVSVDEQRRHWVAWLRTSAGRHGARVARIVSEE